MRDTNKKIQAAISLSDSTPAPPSTPCRRDDWDKIAENIHRVNTALPVAYDNLKTLVGELWTKANFEPKTWKFKGGGAANDLHCSSPATTGSLHP